MMSLATTHSGRAPPVLAPLLVLSSMHREGHEHHKRRDKLHLPHIQHGRALLYFDYNGFHAI
jgi:hypothetical protein